jgi:tRNA pseudouridine38-40 synthase
MLVEYNGGKYNGWQTQQKGRFIQCTLERAIEKVANAPIRIHASGRTDKGVHASGQIIHFDTSANRSSHGWVCGVSSHLPADISIRWAEQLSQDFHARFSALARRYRYFIYEAPYRSALLPDGVTRVRETLDVKAMQTAAQDLVGEHDFSSFQDAQCQSKSPFRHLFACQVEREGDYIVIDVTANAFLHHMVRNIVGTLLPIGKGKKPVAWLKNVLVAKDRRAAGITASPNGLYLVKVYYPSEFAVIDHEIGPHFHPGRRCPAPCEARIMIENQKESDK